MKEAFITKRFNAASQKLIVVINEILANYAIAGYDISLRQLYYQLVSRNIVENTEKSYKNIGKLVSDARLAGLVDWDMIRDRGRVTVGNSHWDSPADIVRSAANSFRICRWENQKNYIEVMVEKQALEGVLIPVCRDHDVRFMANKGYTSSSAARDTSIRFNDAMSAGKEVHVIYLGDHDPSGIDMSRDVDDRLRLFTYGVGVTVHRIALNMDQVKTFNPPPQSGENNRFPRFRIHQEIRQKVMGVRRYRAEKARSTFDRQNQFVDRSEKMGSVRQDPRGGPERASQVRRQLRQRQR